MPHTVRIQTEKVHCMSAKFDVLRNWPNLYKSPTTKLSHVKHLQCPFLYFNLKKLTEIMLWGGSGVWVVDDAVPVYSNIENQNSM